MAKRSRRKSEKGKRIEVPDAMKLLEAEAAHMHKYSASPWAIYQVNLRDKWLNLMMKAVAGAHELKSKNPSKDLFTAFWILGTRWVSNHQAIRALLMIGRYGECTALLRMLLELTDLIAYLAAYPEEAESWIEAFSREPVKGNLSFEKGRGKYSPTNIRQKLDDKGLNPTPSQVYAQFSSAIHPSLWGTIHYGQQSIQNPSIVDIGFEARFDTRMAFGLGLQANQTLPSPIWAFLEICQSTEANKRDWRAVKLQYEEMLPTWEIMINEVDGKFAEIMAESFRLFSNGAVFEDIERYVESVVSPPNEIARE